jgi:hypothetical protein
VLFSPDQASEYKLCGEPAGSVSDDVVTPWALAEGQILHDMVAYIHKLSRHTKNSRDPVIAALKLLCPVEPVTRRRGDDSQD